MSKRPPSLALKRRYLLRAEIERQTAMAFFGSRDVFWLRLAEDEWRLRHDVDGNGEGPIPLTAFYTKLGLAIVRGGRGSANRYEEARTAVEKHFNSPALSKENKFEAARDIRGELNNVLHHLQPVVAWTRFCVQENRLPYASEFFDYFFAFKYAEKIKTAFTSDYGRPPDQTELKKALKDAHYGSDELKKIFRFPERSDFTDICNSLGLEFLKGNHRTKIKKLLKSRCPSGSTRTTRPCPLQILTGDPVLQKYLLENWTIGEFFEWLDDLRNLKGGRIDLLPGLRGADKIFQIWNRLLDSWMEGLTADGSYPDAGELPLGVPFMELCSRMGFAPAAVELLIWTNDATLSRAMRISKKTLHDSEIFQLRKELASAVPSLEGRGVYDLLVKEVSSLAPAVDELRLYAAQYVIDSYAPEGGSKELG